MNQSKQEREQFFAKLKKEEEEFPKKNAKFLLDFLKILLRIQHNRPTDKNLEIIKDTMLLLKQINIYKEKEYNLDELIK